MVEPLLPHAFHPSSFLMTMMMRRPWRTYLKLLNVHVGQALVGKDDGQTLLGHITVCVWGGGCVSVGVCDAWHEAWPPPSLPPSSLALRTAERSCWWTTQSLQRRGQTAGPSLSWFRRCPLLCCWCGVSFVRPSVENAWSSRAKLWSWRSNAGEAALNARGARIVCRRACVSA